MKVRQWLKWLAVALGSAVLVLTVVCAGPMGCVALMACSFDAMETEQQARVEPARTALQDTNLAAWAESGECYDPLTLGGACVVFEPGTYLSEAERAQLLADMAGAEGWHVQRVPGSAAREAMSACVPDAAFLSVPEEMSFEAWFLRENDAYPDVLPDRRPSGEWTLALYDMETNLFLHMDEEAVFSTFYPGNMNVPGLTGTVAAALWQHESHGGFHGDGVSYRALCIPAQERSRVAAQIAAVWQPGPVTAAEYCMLHARQVYASLPLYPAADVTFDWWFFSDDYAAKYPDKGEAQAWGGEDFPQVMQAQHAHASPNWTMGFYDEETGLLVLYEYDS